jgi:hypothetical protein
VDWGGGWVRSGFQFSSDRGWEWNWVDLETEVATGVVGLWD